MNPWKILGVHRQNTEEEVHEAYIKLARKYHPDVAKDNKQQFSIITGAYSLLKNAEDTEKFIAQLRAVGKECAPCKGQGATFKQRGMTGRVMSTCENCEGTGITLKKEKKK